MSDEDRYRKRKSDRDYEKSPSRFRNNDHGKICDKFRSRDRSNRRDQFNRSNQHREDRRDDNSHMNRSSGSSRKSFNKRKDSSFTDNFQDDQYSDNIESPKNRKKLLSNDDDRNILKVPPNKSTTHEASNSFPNANVQHNSFNSNLTLDSDNPFLLAPTTVNISYEHQSFQTPPFFPPFPPNPIPSNLDSRDINLNSFRPPPPPTPPPRRFNHVPALEGMVTNVPLPPSHHPFDDEYIQQSMLPQIDPLQTRSYGSNLEKIQEQPTYLDPIEEEDVITATEVNLPLKKVLINKRLCGMELYQEVMEKIGTRRDEMMITSSNEMIKTSNELHSIDDLLLSFQPSPNPSIPKEHDSPMLLIEDNEEAEDEVKNDEVNDEVMEDKGNQSPVLMAELDEEVPQKNEDDDLYGDLDELNHVEVEEGDDMDAVVNVKSSEVEMKKEKDPVDVILDRVLDVELDAKPPLKPTDLQFKESNEMKQIKPRPIPYFLQDSSITRLNTFSRVINGQSFSTRFLQTLPRIMQLYE